MQTKEQLQTEAVARDMMDASNDQRRDDFVMGELGERERAKIEKYETKVGESIRKSLNI